MTEYARQFLTTTGEQIDKLISDSLDAIGQAADALANALQDGQQLFLFGSGHSALVARDGALPDLIAELDATIAAGDAPDNTLAVLLADVVRRAEITKPGYTQTDGV